MSFDFTDFTGQSGDEQGPPLAGFSPSPLFGGTPSPAGAVAGAANPTLEIPSVMPLQNLQLPALPTAGPGFSPAAGFAPEAGGGSNSILSILAALSGLGNIFPSSGKGPGAQGNSLLSTLLGGGFGSGLGRLLGFSGESSGLGGGIGSAIGALGGLPFGPLGSFLGSFGGGFLGDIFGGLFGGGLNKFAKPEAEVQALEGQGDPLEKLLGEYIQSAGINAGHDLSESPAAMGNFAPRAYADILELLSHEQLPGVNDQGVINFGNLGQFGQPVEFTGIAPLSTIEREFPNVPTLSAAQIEALAPELQALIAQYAASARTGSPDLANAAIALAEKYLAAQGAQ